MLQLHLTPSSLFSSGNLSSDCRTIVAQGDQVDAWPVRHLAGEDGGDAIAAGKVAEGTHVHGEAAAVRNVLRPVRCAGEIL